MYLGNPPLNKDRSLEAEVEDIKYLIIWGVDLDQERTIADLIQDIRELLSRQTAATITVLTDLIEDLDG